MADDELGSSAAEAEAAHAALVAEAAHAALVAEAAHAALVAADAAQAASVAEAAQAQAASVAAAAQAALAAEAAQAQAAPVVAADAAQAQAAPVAEAAQAQAAPVVAAAQAQAQAAPVAEAAQAQAAPVAEAAQAQAAPVTAAAPVEHHRTRTFFVGLLGVLAVVSLLLLVVAVWSSRTVFDSDKVAGIADAALQQPTIVKPLAQRATDQALVAVDAEQRLRDALPAPLKPFTGSIIGGARNVVESGMERVLALDAVRQALVLAIRQAHVQLVKVVQGDGLASPVKVVGDKVQLNTLSLVVRAIDLVQQRTGLVSNVKLPTLNPKDPASVQQQQLEKALGRSLPAGFGQITIYQGDKVSQAADSVANAQRTVLLARRAMWVLLVLTVVFFVAAIVLSRDRRRAVVLLSLGTAAALVIARILIDRFVFAAPTLVADPETRAAVRDVVLGFTGSLQRVVNDLLVLGIIVGVLAFLSGPSKPAVRIRRGVIGDEHTPMGIARRSPQGTAAVCALLALLLFVLFGWSLVTLLLAVALVGFGGWVVWGGGAAAVPNASPSP